MCYLGVIIFILLLLLFVIIYSCFRGGTGVVETTIFLCNSLSTGTCRNATEYVFWDAVHPSEAANELLANSLLLQGIDLIT
ncbi:hypothetical protein Dimus_004050 [Dionaea muscipula]